MQVPKVMQPTEGMDTVCNERQAQSTANKALNTKALRRQAQNGETVIITRSIWISRKADRLCYF